MPSASDDPVALGRLIAGAEEVRVHDGGMDDTGPLQSDVALTVAGRRDVAELLDRLVVTAVTDGMCMCLGSSTLVFRAHGHRLATVAVHHGTHLRWSGWSGDATLADGPELVEWWAARGYRTPLEDQVRSRTQRSEADVRNAHWSAAIPPAVSDLGAALIATSRTGDVPGDLVDDLADRLTASVPDDVERCRQLLIWFGAGSGRRSGFPMHEGIPGLLLARVPVAVVVAAVGARPLDPAVLRGATRHLTGWKSRPSADLDRIPRAVWDILVDAAAASGDADTWQTVSHIRDQHC